MIGFVFFPDSQRDSPGRRLHDGLLRQHLQRRDAHSQGPLQDGRAGGSTQSGKAEE